MALQQGMGLLSQRRVRADIDHPGCPAFVRANLSLPERAPTWEFGERGVQEIQEPGLHFEFMLYSVKDLYGNKLSASDGEIGHVKDFYFDDQNWAIRYLVVDTGSWLPGRQVLLSPYSVGHLDPADNTVAVNLTKRQIEDSPSIESHKPLSRHYEEQFYRYYGWPFYWSGSGLWGMSGSPILELPQSTADENTPGEPEAPPSADANLRSTQSIKGYHFKLGDRMEGQVSDFFMDPHYWAIRYLVVKFGRLGGREVLIPASAVSEISFNESTVFAVNLRETVEARPAHQIV